MAKTYNSLTVANTNSGNAILASDHAKVFENVNNYRVPPMCRVYRNAALNHTSNLNSQDFAWDTQNFDTEESADQMWEASPNPERITIKTAGVYLICGLVTFSPNATGFRAVEITINTSTMIFSSHVPGAASPVVQSLPFSVTYSLAVNDYIRARGYQNSGGNLAYTVGTQNCHMNVTWLGQAS